MKRLPVIVKLEPREVSKGTSQVTLNIKNIGEDELETLEVGLSSLDQGLLEVQDSLKWLSNVRPGETAVVTFDVSACGSARVYIKIFGYVGERRFSWESPAIRLKVGDEVAEIVSFLIQGEAKQEVKKKIKAEVIIRGLGHDSKVSLDYWVNMPNEVFTHLGEADIEFQEVGVLKSSIEFTPESEGLYTVYVYLYEGLRQIDRDIDKVLVTRVL